MGGIMVKGKEFGDLILERRREKNLSLQKLSNEIGGEITPSYINRLEKKEKGKPSFDVVCQLSLALDLDIADVFSSFGYTSMIPNPQPQKTDIVVTDNEGTVIAIECKSNVNNLSTNQIDYLQEVVNHIIDYSVVDEGYGYLPKIIQLVENVRNEARK